MAELLENFPNGSYEPVCDYVLGDNGICVMAHGDEEWILEFNGLVTTKGPQGEFLKRGGAQIMPKSPRGYKNVLSFKFDFPVSNNEAEYKALAIEMMMAIHLHVTNLVVKGDSNLVVKQVDGEFAVREPAQAPYRALIQRVEERIP